MNWRRKDEIVDDNVVVRWWCYIIVTITISYCIWSVYYYVDVGLACLGDVVDIGWVEKQHKNISVNIYITKILNTTSWCRFGCFSLPQCRTPGLHYSFSCLSVCLFILSIYLSFSWLVWLLSILLNFHMYIYRVKTNFLISLLLHYSIINHNETKPNHLQYSTILCMMCMLQIYVIIQHSIILLI